MNEELLSRVTDAVWQKISGDLPRALCVGNAPANPDFVPVTTPPWDMVVLCSLSPAQLLKMPTDEVCRALLEGKPVYLMEEGLEHRKYNKDRARALQAMLMAKERELRSLGVKLWGQDRGKKLLTARDVQNLRLADLPKNAVLTPLARDLLEGKG